MDFKRGLILATCCLLYMVKYVQCLQGPVFINPDNANSGAAASQTTSSYQGNYVTQTVYGFLDFTTTIGSTVMVFSPQSASVAPQEVKTKSNEISSNIIDIKPLVTKNEIEIKPTKTQPLTEKKTSEKIVSVIQIKSDKSVTSIVETKSSAVIKEGKPKKLIVPTLLNSKVEVVDGVAFTKLSVAPSIRTKVEIVSELTKLVEPIIASKVESREEPTSSAVTNIVQIKSNYDEPAAIIGNNIGEPEYDFLSRQPSEMVEETFKVINLKPSSKFLLKHRPSTEIKKNGPTKRGDHPTGLVTKLGGTVVKDGITTVIETSVIGTYISGKYAQVLQSTSRKINPTQSIRILKTAAPSLTKGNKQRHIEPTPAATVNDNSSSLPAENAVKSTRKSSGVSGAYKRLKNRQKESDAAVSEGDNEHFDASTAQPNYKKSQKNKSQSHSARNSKHNTSAQSQHASRTGRNRKTPTSKQSVHSELSPTTSSAKRYTSSRKTKQSKPANENQSTTSNNGYTRRAFKPKVQPSAAETGGSSSSSLYKFKLNRSPGRWQYKTTTKPRVSIRKQNNDEAGNNNETRGLSSSPMPPSSGQEVPHSSINDVVTSQARSDDVDSLEESESIASIIDDESATANKLDVVAPAFPVETIKVEISTPSDFGDIYYEIATIKSPYTFQVGNMKNTRYVTVTSTFERMLERSDDPSPKPSEPLTENILATSSNYAKDNNFLDSSIATLPPLYLATDMETPPLETLTETFSTTQTMLKTHILPIVRHGNDTSSSTLVQTYLVTRFVTATKTLPPMEAYQFIPSKVLNEFNSHLDEAGSELHLELEFGDENDREDGPIRKVSLPSDLDLANIGSKFDLTDVDKSKILEAHARPKKAQSTVKPTINELPNPNLPSPDQLQQLALYRLLNPQVAGAQGQIITTSKPVVKVETIYETFILPVTQGHNTIQSTISRLKGTITKTDYEFGTSTIAPAFPPLQPQLPQIPQINPFLPQPQPQLIVTSSPVVQSTMVTQINSKVLKLTFGAKTAHTTIFSTVIVPTFTTSYITASIPVPTAAYPGYFPAPFPAYPYVG